MNARWVGLTCAAAMVGCASAGRASGSEAILDVVVEARRGIDGRDLVFARSTARRIFADANVRLNWHEAREPNAPLTRRTIVIVTNNSRMDDVFANPDVLGSVAQPGVRAYVHYDRVAQFARDHDKEPGMILGGVIAHEIGHLVLGDAHSASGIMSAAMDTRPTSVFALLPEQAVALRRALSTGSNR